jgi:hypothetical protein
MRVRDLSNSHARLTEASELYTRNIVSGNFIIKYFVWATHCGHIVKLASASFEILISSLLNMKKYKIQCHST